MMVKKNHRRKMERSQISFFNEKNMPLVIKDAWPVFTKNFSKMEPFSMKVYRRVIKL